MSDVMSTTGVIEYVKRTGSKASFKLDDGHWYGVFVGQSLEAEEGDTVTFRYKVAVKGDREYRNAQGKIRGSVSASGSRPAAAAAPSGGGGAPAPRPSDDPLAVRIPRDRCIVRQSSLKAAVDFIAAMGPEMGEAYMGGFSPEDILAGRPAIELAKAFERYASGDVTVESAAAFASGDGDVEDAGEDEDF